jgi:hypothetical protein
MPRYTDSSAFSAEAASIGEQDIDRSPCRHGVRYPTGTIMNRLHWTAVLVVFLLGGGFAVAALIIVVVMVALRVAAQLFDDGPD